MNNNLLIHSLPQYDGNRLNWRRKSDKFHGTSEASDLGIRIEDIANGTWMGSVYNDSCDQGIVLRGRDGNVAFFLDGSDDNPDYTGGVSAWHFKSLNEKGRPDGRFEVTIWND